MFDLRFSLMWLGTLIGIRRVQRQDQTKARRSEVVYAEAEITNFLLGISQAPGYRWSPFPTGKTVGRVLFRGSKILRMQIIKSWKNKIDGILRTDDFYGQTLEIEWVDSIPLNDNWT